jgi:beta-galactosidase
MATTGEPAALGFSADRSEIAAGQRDVAHVTLQILDAQGRTVPTASSMVSFSVDGAARLIGVDNGDPADHDDYRSNNRKAFNGLCLAIVQSTGTPGEIRVAASSPGLKSSALVIRAIA